MADWFDTQTQGSGPGGAATLADLQGWNQQLFGGALTDLSPWVGQTNAYQNLAGSAQAQSYAQQQAAQTPVTAGPVAQTDYAPAPAAAAPSVNPNDPRAVLSQIYTNAGLDPNNPGGNLANVDYFIQKMNQTGGWQGSNQAYWQSRLQQEITQAQGGGTGPLVDTGGGGGGTGFPGAFTFQPWTQQFVAPTDVTEQNDPGYQARLQQGLQAVQRGAAAQGTLLTGGTQQALDRYAQDYASNEYQNVYNRALGQYQQAYQQYLGGYGQNVQQYQLQYGAASDAYNRAWNQQLFGAGQQQQGYLNAQNEQQNQWNRLYSLYQTGYGAAGGAGAAGQNYGSQASNLLTGAGNAAAAGQVGSANAWNSAFGNLANMGQYGALGLYGNQNKTTTQPYPTQGYGTGIGIPGY